MIAALAALSVLAGPALAQFSLGGGDKKGMTRYTEEERRREAEAERTYQNVIRSTRPATETQAYDPWANLRQPTPQPPRPAR